MTPLVHLIYVSSATVAFSEHQLKDMLVQARKANKEYDITGLLLYQDGNFMQIIEGLETEVNRLFLNIEADHRHSGMIVLLNEEIKSRNFPDWSMGFKNVLVGEIEGFSDFFTKTKEDHITSEEVATLLEIFKGNTALSTAS